jgi:hypothetical protein
MVAVIVQPPAGLPEQFSHTGKASMTTEVSCSGTDVERFEMACLLGKMQAIPDALKVVACTGDVRVIVRDAQSSGPGKAPRVQVLGQIIAWQPELENTVRHALSEVDMLCFGIAVMIPWASVTIDFRLTRTLLRAAA